MTQLRTPNSHTLACGGANGSRSRSPRLTSNQIEAFKPGRSCTRSRIRVRRPLVVKNGIETHCRQRLCAGTRNVTIRSHDEDKAHWQAMADAQPL